ncbi:TPA: hypothetical protein ACTR19_002578 [Yersinia enterocolitica]|uniref:hypothetical protein n=1 Tax=Yersinia enterocolitica TaxID=630 RepID=UPI002812B89C|nr:hypothetical protein [Yersinia enterocolitica]EKN6094682.1 hypothetical protein [Yersinia enterocolitica]HDL6751361.1 hypothetical protein [Yersinia enterocolitica]HDL7877831.1 hypothetical protein [Yersinia enterocolitica]HDL7889637.1 hypothetical protein [Yersinia enterocolitica]
MTTPTQPDTTSLLTILGVIAAVWALISPTDRLRLRFCMTWRDWFFGGGVFLLIHYLVFAPTLERLGLYYSFGPWKWGLDSSSAVYLLLLSIACYFFWRTRFPTLSQGRVHIFRELIEKLHLTRRYDELVLLVEPQLPKLISLTKQQPLFVRWIDRIDRQQIDIAAVLRGEKPIECPAWRNRLSFLLQKLKSWILVRDDASTQAHEVLLNLVTSPELTIHLAITHPHFCLRLLQSNEAIHSDFIDYYIDALLDAPGSRLYVELKNNQNLSVGSRLYLPENNRLLRFFFADAKKALKNGLDKAIGEAICRRLDEDNKLIVKLNKPLSSYYDVGRFRCPINSGITLFEIMIHEGIHQGMQDHMWLHYFGHFAEKILKQMTVPPDEENYLEWPTPFHFLLYRLVSVATDWVEQCTQIKDLEIPEATRSANSFDRHYISKEATKLLGSMLGDIIPSKKISERFKTYLLEVVIRSHINIQRDANLADVSSLFLTAVTFGANMPTKTSYRVALKGEFQKIDHVIRGDASAFEQAINASLG